MLLEQLRRAEQHTFSSIELKGTGAQPKQMVSWDWYGEMSVFSISITVYVLIGGFSHPDVPGELDQPQKYAVEIAYFELSLTLIGWRQKPVTNPLYHYTSGTTNTSTERKGVR